jgi:hypothetical protein
VRHEPELIARVRHRRGHRDDEARRREMRSEGPRRPKLAGPEKERASSRKRRVESVAPAPPRSARIESPGPARDPAPSRAEAERTRRALARRSTCRDTPSRARSTTESPKGRTRANVACRVERRRRSGKYRDAFISLEFRSVYYYDIRRSFQSSKKCAPVVRSDSNRRGLCGCWRLRRTTGTRRGVCRHRERRRSAFSHRSHRPREASFVMSDAIVI